MRYRTAELSAIVDDDDRIDSVVDAHSILASYNYLCEQQHGLSDPPVIIVGTSSVLMDFGLAHHLLARIAVRYRLRGLSMLKALCSLKWF